MSTEYPKVIRTGGVEVTVIDAADEARWRNAPPAGPVYVAPVPEPDSPAVEPEPVGLPADSLNDVKVEMDNPVYNEPVKKKRATRKKKT